MALLLTDLKCNNMTAPIGIDDLPHFSFKTMSDDSDFRIAYYRIIVREKENVIWDSGFVNEDRQILIPYGGKKLMPETRYYWQLTVRGNDNDEAIAESFFETGRMKPFNWSAKWITSDPRGIFIGNHWCKNTTAPYMRKTFELEEIPEDATLYISGIGYYECYVNGMSVKDTVLDPAFTEYDKAVMYKTHKITNLSKGKNVLAISLGDGFYNADTEDVWNFVNAAWRDHPKCICELKMVFKDGHEERILSDKSFKGTVGPIIENDTRSAETYDARRELGEWTEYDYDDSGWKPVTVTKAPGGALEGQYTTPMKVTATYKPAKIIKVSDTYWVVDVGFNTTGRAEISFSAPEGTKIEMKYAELINDDYSIREGIDGCVKESERDKFQKETYIAAGKPYEIWHSQFKYNGFRYIAVKCETGVPEDLDFTIQEIRTDLKLAGEFVCSDPVINKIQEITCRATKTNFHGMPTDCPHREKNGWTGDAQLSAEQMLYNFDAQAAYTRWLEDVARAQRMTGQLPGIIPSTGWGFNWGSGPAWDSVCAVIPYTMYLYCGDTRILKRMYPIIKRYIAFCDTMATDNICDFGLVDWCPPVIDWHRQCDLAITDTGYFYYDVLTAAKIAKILGLDDECEFYEKKADEIRKSFREHFIDDSGDVPKLKNCVTCQTSLACVVYYGLCDEDEKKYFIDAIIEDIHRTNDHLDVGIMGQKYLAHVFGDAGYLDILIKAITDPTYPGLGNMVAQGATTLWEDFQGIGSQNHHMYGDISAVFYASIAGIRPCEEEPGFKKIIFTPNFPNGMKYAEAWHETPYGKAGIRWDKRENGYEVHLAVPSGCSAKLVLPEGMVNAETGENTALIKAGKYYLTVK